MYLKVCLFTRCFGYVISSVTVSMTSRVMYRGVYCIYMCDCSTVYMCI